MKGISYITDERGNKTALVIDMKKYATAVEDFLDGLVAEERKSEPKEEFNKAVSRILKKKKTSRV